MSEHKRNLNGARKIVDLLGRAQLPETPPQPMREDACTGCMYAAFASADVNEGECHANPPQMLLLMEQDRLGQVKQKAVGAFPAIARHAWCGLFESAIEPLPEKAVVVAS